MNRFKGFTLIELLILVAIIGILGTIVVSALMVMDYKKQHNQTSQDNVNYYEDKQDKRTYIENNKRSSDMVTLKRHTNGVLYAYDSDDVCKEVQQ